MFSRVKAEHASEIAHQALMRGLEHSVLSTDGCDHVTFFFTSENAKNTFDTVVYELGHSVDGTLPVHQMVDAVVEGTPASEVLGLFEGMTKGIKNAINKGKVKQMCSDCETPVPVYSGRYPSKCPDCGEPFKVAKAGE